MDELRKQLIRRLKYLRAFVRKKEAEGFEFFDIPDFKFDRSLKTKKEIQRELNKANKWTAKKLYEHSEYYPTLTILNYIREQIEKLPQIRYFKRGIHIEVSEHKDRLLSILNDIESSINTRKEEAEIEKYFQSVQAEIVDAIAVVQYDSDQSRVNYALSKLATLLLGRPLTQEEAENFEMYDADSEDYDLAGSAEYIRKTMQSPFARL